MLRVLKTNSPSQMKCLLTLSSTTSATLWSAPIQNDSILLSNGCCLEKPSERFSDFTAPTPTKKPVPRFQSTLPRLPLPPSRMSSISRTQFFVVIVWFSRWCYFEVVSLALTVCVWPIDSTGFLKTTATGCHVEKRKKKVLFLWNGEGREEKKATTA